MRLGINTFAFSWTLMAAFPDLFLVCKSPSCATNPYPDEVAKIILSSFAPEITPAKVSPDSAFNLPESGSP